jgi:glycerophosphoryl diester phosphodiesterase
MLVLRGTNAVFPSGSSLNHDNFYKLASSVFSVSVVKEASGAFAKVDVIQGVDNANRIMVTNDKGEVVVGDINPNSMALRPNWDTVIHRGWVNGAKENTIPAFYLAKENGYSWVECDIRMSSDNVPVLAHDATITSENGASVLTVAESTVSQLQSITLQNHERFGAIKMNTLAELLDMARCLGMKIVLDIKVGGESAMKTIAKTVLRYGMSDNVIYMPIGTTNASYIKMVDKNASFDFVMYGTNPTSATDLTGYVSLLNGSNHVNLDIQANTWEFTSTVIDAINSVGLGLCAWNVTSENIGKCIDSGMLRITKHNNFDDVDLNTDYLKNKKFW